MIIDNYLRSIKYKPNCIIHAGAHYAQEKDAYVSLEPSTIVWIEGDPEIFSKLDKIIDVDSRQGPPRQICRQALLSDVDGKKVNFHRFNNLGASSSIFQATPLLTSNWPGVVETGSVDVLETTRLDSLLSSLEIKPEDVDVMVFDIQGSELLALNGSGEYLEKVKFIEVELSQEAIYAGAPLATDVDSFLQARGFVRQTDMIWHGDAVYSRSE